MIFFGFFDCFNVLDIEFFFREAVVTGIKMRQNTFYIVLTYKYDLRTSPIL